MGSFVSSSNNVPPSRRRDAQACAFDLDSRIEAQLRKHFEHVLTEPIPDRFLALIAALGKEETQ